MRALDSRNQQAVVLDIDPRRISELELGHFPWTPRPWLPTCACRNTSSSAGLPAPGCAGIIALTNDDQANLSVAVAPSCCAPSCPCSAVRIHRTPPPTWRPSAPTRPFNAFEVFFAEHLAMGLKNPGQHCCTMAHRRAWRPH